jgi:wobble nucleotide-excising tRNase
MLDNRGFKAVVAFVGVVLWFFPQAALGEDTEVKNRLSYISKIVAVIEGSIIKIEGNVRFVKRQTEKTIAEASLSANRLDNLEAKVENIEDLLNTITVEIVKINDGIQNVEKDLEGLFRGACRNAILCKRKK